MRIKRIYFIEPRSPGAHIYSRTPLPRLGSILLATILKNKGYESKAFIEDIAEPDWEELKKADLIGISSITSTAPRAFKLADGFRSLGIPVVMGGPHSTFLPEESLAHADYVVRGEGEETLVELLERLEDGLPPDDVKGLSFRRGEAVIHTPDRPLVRDLDAAPIPDFSLVHNWGERATVPVATSRGCPFGCRFCSVIQMFGRKYRFKSVERVMEEIRRAARKGTHIFFVDDNFAADKKRTKALLRRVIDEGLDIEWSAQVRTDIAKDDELLDLMARSGCFMVFVGFESINPRTLSLYNKKQNPDDIVYCIRKLRAASIRIHGMFVFGGDTDDIDTIRSTEKFARRLRINSVQFMMLTPLPGTPVFQELMQQGRIIHTDWSKYDAHHAVFEPKLMTPFELHTETLKAMSGFYSCGAVLRNLLRGDLFYTAVTIYGKRSLKKIRTPSRKYLRNLRDMVSAKFDEKAGELRDYLLTKKRAVNIVLTRMSEEGAETEFFRTFFDKIGRKLVVSDEAPCPSHDSIAIMPIICKGDESDRPGRGLLVDLTEKYKATIRDALVVPLETHSLYRACVDLGLLMGIRLRKIRAAYEKALETLNGKTLECSALIVISALKPS